jgi:hypothetical protein
VLSGADDAYGRLALAAAHRDRPAWRRARVAVEAAERAVAAQLDVVRGAA